VGKAVSARRVNEDDSTSSEEEGENFAATQLNALGGGGQGNVGEKG